MATTLGESPLLRGGVFTCDSTGRGCGPPPLRASSSSCSSSPACPYSLCPGIGLTIGSGPGGGGKIGFPNWSNCGCTRLGSSNRFGSTKLLGSKPARRCMQCNHDARALAVKFSIFPGYDFFMPGVASCSPSNINTVVVSMKTSSSNLLLSTVSNCLRPSPVQKFW